MEFLPLKRTYPSHSNAPPPLKEPKQTQHAQDFKAPREKNFPCSFVEAFFFSKNGLCRQKNPHKPLWFAKTVTGTHRYKKVVGHLKRHSRARFWLYPRKENFNAQCRCFLYSCSSSGPPPLSVSSPEEIKCPLATDFSECQNCGVFWFGNNQKGSDWMLEKVHYLYGVPHDRAILSHECEACTGVYWEGGHEERNIHSGTFYKINAPWLFRAR